MGKDNRQKPTVRSSDHSVEKTRSLDSAPRSSVKKPKEPAAPLKKSVDAAVDLLSWEPTPTPTKQGSQDEFTEFSGFQSASSFNTIQSPRQSSAKSNNNFSFDGTTFI